MGGDLTIPDSSALMQRGIALLNAGSEVELRGAVSLFDEAITIRRTLAVAEDHWIAYLTAASWMNRGDALTRLSRVARVESLAEAVRSYDEALAVLHEVPLDANPLYRRRRAIAWMNRGITLQEQGTPESFVEAAASFDRTIETVGENTEHTIVLACAWMNRGNVLLRIAGSHASEARRSAEKAILLARTAEESDPIAAETSLKARHILCQAIAEILAGAPSDEVAGELIPSATDAVEEGLRLARHWEAQGETRFSPLLTGLFGFGVAAYRTYLPHFLADFVLENIDSQVPDRASIGLAGQREMYSIAVEALAAAAGELHRDGFASLNTPRFDRLMETLRTLRLIESRARNLGRVQEGI